MAEEFAPRKCGECTACCEGWLEGEALGHKFYRGRPCHFLGDGCCSIYSVRPEDPCKSYKCMWLTSNAIPNWMRPDKCGVILTQRSEKGIPYVHATETDRKMDSAVLSWVIQACFNNGWNLRYTIDHGNNYLGSKEFAEVMKDAK